MVMNSFAALLLCTACFSSLWSVVTSFAPAIQHHRVLLRYDSIAAAPAASSGRTATNTGNNASPATSYAITRESSFALSMAGFGGASSSKKQEKQKKGGGGASASKQLMPKLRAKSQWDRYLDMKLCKKVTVGVRIKGEDEDSSTNDWLEVGRVRSEGDEHTTVEVAVARQRALIAEHGKRLYPVKIPSNAILEWGYLNDEEGEEENENKEWITVDKSKGDDAPDGIEKKIGFEGISHPPTGYYCFYNQGRIVDKEEEGKFNRGSEKI